MSAFDSKIACLSFVKYLSDYIWYYSLLQSKLIIEIDDNYN